MPQTVTAYQPETLTRTELDGRAGWWLLEFGSNGCPHCMAAQQAIQELLSHGPRLQHLRIEDGRGRPLGRSFRVKLWPTLILVQDGHERARVVRPTRLEDLADIARWTDTL